MIESVLPDDIQDAATAFHALGSAGFKIYVELKKLREVGNQKVDSLKEFLKEYVSKNPVLLNGSLADLKVFWGADTINLESMDLPDDIKTATNKKFTSLVSTGFLEQDPKTQSFNITEKGKTYIYSPEFVQYVMKQDSEKYMHVSQSLNKTISSAKVSQTVAEGASTIGSGLSTAGVATAVKVGYDVLSFGVKEVNKLVR